MGSENSQRSWIHGNYIIIYEDCNLCLLPKKEKRTIGREKEERAKERKREKERGERARQKEKECEQGNRGRKEATKKEADLRRRCYPSDKNQRFS